MKEIIIASGNNGKIKEVQEIFGNDFKVISIKEIGIDIDVEEDQDSFKENAIKKAEVIAKELGDERFVIADDSGIEVEALNGFPGVYTKRWFDGTDRERNLALINKVNKEAGLNRKIKFITAIAISNGKESFCELGIVNGNVTKKPRGNNGFGFDEIFELENGKTLAELTDDEKNKISARKIALEKIKNYYYIQKSGINLNEMEFICEFKKIANKK